MSVEQKQYWQAGRDYERERIWKGVEELYNNSESTRTPIYQDRMYNYLKNIMWPEHPPEQFRDKSNGE
jgi:hypothetical protein